jgi:hypothetical protein
MKKYTISINQLAEFHFATESTKNRIIQQQLNPNQFKVSWYQTPKSKVKKCIELGCDLHPIYEGIENLINKQTVNDNQKRKKDISIEALRKFIEIKLPIILRNNKYEIIKTKVKSTYINGVEVIVAPDVIVKGIINGKTVLGGIKIHISKNKPFDYSQSKIVANTIATYLKNEIADETVEVLPELCFSLDIFSGKIIASTIDKRTDDLIFEICLNVRKTWDLLSNVA